MGPWSASFPQGFRHFRIPEIDLKIILHLLPYAAIISLLGFMEAISIAKAMAGKTGQRLDPNQELIGQGLANIFGSMAKSYPTSGSFSRSAVNLQAGAVSGLSSVFTSLAVVIVLLVFHAPAVPPSSVRSGGGHHDGRHRTGQCSGFIHAWQAQWYDGAISIFPLSAPWPLRPTWTRVS